MNIFILVVISYNLFLVDIGGKQMIKRFFELLFGDVGMLISSSITCLLSAILFPLFLQQIGTTGIIQMFLVIFLGIFTVGFYASSAISSIFLIVRTGIAKRWVLFALSWVVFIVDAIILILVLV